MRKNALASVLCFLCAPIATLSCGIERWPVKTLADPRAAEVLAAAITQTTVSELLAKVAPAESALKHADATRYPEELVRYQVDALVIGFKQESDQDFHVVIADPANPAKTMIAEIPSEDCVPAPFRNTFAAERASFIQDFGKPTAKFKKLKHPVAVTVTGVGFFDFLHGQTGVAPNGFELHPVLAITKQTAVAPYWGPRPNEPGTCAATQTFATGCGQWTCPQGYKWAKLPHIGDQWDWNNGHPAELHTGIPLICTLREKS